MSTYLIKRLLLFAPTLILATMIVFVLMWVVPGDAALVILVGDEADMTGFDPADLEKLRHELGLDRPVYVRYGDWLWNMVRGDLGVSTFYKTSISGETIKKFAITMELATLGMGMAFLIALPLGALSALKQDTWLDQGARLFTTAGVAIPSFWIGIMVVYLLAYFFDWLPPLGYAVLWEDPVLNLQQMVFPALAIAFHDMAFSARMTRSSMLEVLREDYIRTARAKGLQEWMVVGRHALKNALLPVITISGYQFGRLLGGVIIIETIFLVPGLGNFLVEGILHRDFIAIQAVVTLVAVVILVLNLAIDMVYGFLDPRVRYQ